MFMGHAPQMSQPCLTYQWTKPQFNESCPIFWASSMACHVSESIEKRCFLLCCSHNEYCISHVWMRVSKFTHDQGVRVTYPLSCVSLHRVVSPPPTQMLDLRVTNCRHTSSLTRNHSQLHTRNCVLTPTCICMHVYSAFPNCVAHTHTRTHSLFEDKDTHKHTHTNTHTYTRSVVVWGGACEYTLP